MYMRRRPSRSPARAPSSNRPPNASVYAFCTHDSAALVKPSVCWIFGNPVMTIEISRISIM